MLIEDKDLVQQAIKGDKSAFQSLVLKYQARVFGIAFEILHSTEDAEDVAQESFVKAYLSLPEFQGRSSFYTWLYRIVYNMAIDFKRKQKRSIATLGDSKDLEDNLTRSSLEGEVSSSLAKPDERLNRDEQRAQLEHAFKELSEEHRAVISLREVDGLSYQEIARATGVSRGTVMSRLHYARKKLQSLLAAYYQASSDDSQEALKGSTEKKLLKDKTLNSNLLLADYKIDKEVAHGRI